MSRQNVELIRRSYEAFNRGDLEEALAAVHPDVTLQTLLVPASRWGPVYHGHQGVHEAWSVAGSIFSDFRTVPDRFVDAGNIVLALVRYTGRGLRSGAEVTGQLAHVFTVRDEKVVRVETYADRGGLIAALRGDSSAGEGAPLRPAA